MPRLPDPFFGSLQGFFQLPAGRDVPDDLDEFLFGPLRGADGRHGDFFMAPLADRYCALDTWTAWHSPEPPPWDRAAPAVAGFVKAMEHFIARPADHVLRLFAKPVEKIEVGFLHYILGVQHQHRIGQVVKNRLELDALAGQFDVAFHPAAQAVFFTAQKVPEQAGLDVVDNLGMRVFLPVDLLPHLRIAGKLQYKIRFFRQK